MNLTLVKSRLNWSADHGLFWLVCATALVLRLIYLLEIEASPLFSYPAVDGKTYVLHATSLAAGNWLSQGQGPFWQPPLYPYLLGMIKAIAPDSFIYAIRWFQAILGALTCGLVYLLGRRWFTPKLGLVAGLAASCYGPLIFFDGEVLPASLAVFLNMLGLLLLDRALKQNAKSGFSPRLLFGAGLVFGLASLAVASALSFVVAASVWLFWQRRSLPLVGTFALGTLLVIAPITWRNYAIGDDLVLISCNSGVNFYIGNNANYERTLKTRPGWEWEDLIAEPVAAGIELPSEKSAYFWNKAWGYISAHPLDYLGLLATKSMQFFNGNEVGRNQDIYYWRNYSHLLCTTLWKWGIAFPFGLVSPLALLGLALLLRHKGLNLGILFVLAYSIGIIAFFPTARYRIPLLPLLLLLAAYAAWWFWESLRTGQGRQTILGLATLIVLGFLANARIGAMNMEGDAAIHYNLGQAYVSKRQLDKAHHAYAQSVTQDSTYWQAWVNLGSVTALQGNMPIADQIFRRVTQARPGQPEVWVNLAHSSMALGKIEAAVQAYEQALILDPYLPRIYAELLQVHIRRGALEQAQELLDKALAHYPNERQKLLSLYENMRRRSGAPGR